MTEVLENVLPIGWADWGWCRFSFTRLPKARFGEKVAQLGLGDLSQPNGTLSFQDAFEVWPLAIFGWVAATQIFFLKFIPKKFGKWWEMIPILTFAYVANGFKNTNY